MFASLGAFIKQLESEGELLRITQEVDPLLDVAAIANLVSKSDAPHPPSPGAQRTDPRFFNRGGPALLFENVRGSDTPLIINAFGSYRRMEMALGCHGITQDAGFAQIAETIAGLVKPEPPKSLGEAVAKAKQFAPLLKIGPKRKKGAGACQEVILTGDQIDLRTLPIIRCWPLDGDFASLGYPADVNAGIEGLDPSDDVRGRYITLAGIHTIHADDADAKKPSSHNIGMYRVQLLGKDRVAMHWHIHHDGASHWRSWKKRGEPMPVAIVLGGESVLPYAATCPLPPGISELLMAGFLNGRGIEMVRARTVPLWVPANAEMVIEGWVSHEAGTIGYNPRRDGPLGPGAVFEGPFGDHTGFYSLPDRYPIVQVSAVTRRKNAVYPTTIVGLPPQEDYYLGKATERIMLPLLKTIIPDIDDYDLPLFGAFHNCAALKITKHYPMQGRRLMHGVWGAGQMSWTKTIFVVDEQTNVHDTFAVLRAAALHCHPVRDVEMTRGPLDILDHAAPRLGAGTKIGFDCTPKWDGEQVGGLEVDGVNRADASLFVMPETAKVAWLETVRAMSGVVDARLPDDLGRGWLFVSIDKREPGSGARVLEAVLGHDGKGYAPPFVVVVDASVDLDDTDMVLFHWCAHTDAGRDAQARRDPAMLGFDATPKMPGDERNGEPVREWPPILEMPAEEMAWAREVVG